MKGIVFTEFLEMVDDSFGYETTEAIIKKADLPSGGVYTGIGTYSHSEMIALVKGLSAETHVKVQVLVQTFGEHMLGRFVDLFPDFFSTVPDVLSFLENVDGYIHGEVRKLYPNATLPEIATRRLDDGQFELIYKSPRHLGDFAEGLIAGAIRHFGEPFAVQRTDLPNEGQRQCVKFMLAPRP
ncbi:MAG: heme NO-binding domain-containing protein [Rhizobiales bacterium]|nr:heme NO-binding domain-containing protein [Hyphomicrobiales bacterium]MBO6699695.1 heme NO-binding domain-containing protein [Hyphomicrobiales bacterium]MBO6737233.1 heme NO-binding domain-containing protein [Hyphomicrobiales bacterium]MBO6911693.1 heme NO-binding domain-containing protein [Hyphomicrobiales bacterium]MBO6954885.1 heme NO-binding domain-containing protein [Hyphomicrobiales bacterium]